MLFKKKNICLHWLTNHVHTWLDLKILNSFKIQPLFVFDLFCIHIDTLGMKYTLYRSTEIPAVFGIWGAPIYPRDTYLDIVD